MTITATVAPEATIAEPTDVTPVAASEVPTPALPAVETPDPNAGRTVPIEAMTDSLREAVDILLVDIRAERDARLAVERAHGSKVQHARAVLIALAYIDAEGKWVGSGSLNLSAVAQDIVPNPNNYAYSGSQKRKQNAASLLPGEESYGKDCDSVADSLKYAAKIAGRLPATSRPSRGGAAAGAKSQDRPADRVAADASARRDEVSSVQGEGAVQAVVAAMPTADDSARETARWLRALVAMPADRWPLTGNAHEDLLSACKAYVDHFTAMAAATPKRPTPKRPTKRTAPTAPAEAAVTSTPEPMAEAVAS